MDYEVEILPGLKPFALDELRRRFGAAIHIDPLGEEDGIRFRYSGDERSLLDLRTVVAVYRVERFDIPRPRALLGHVHFTRLMRDVDAVRRLHPLGAFRTFRVSAAGSHSTVFRRLRAEIGTQSGLVDDPEAGDLLLRVRPSTRGGWEVLLRLSPRPLSARAWRVCDMPGALNATIAAAMVEWTQPEPHDRFLNLMCGSGTLLIERLLRCSAEQAVGCDIDQAVLACAQENLAAANLSDAARLFCMDATHLDFPARSFGALAADLPWGQLVGSREEIESLYPAVLAEAARVAVPGAPLVIITHAVRLFDRLLPRMGHLWRVERTQRVFQGGQHPRIYLLRRAREA